ncbi:phage distal tail protein [Priestia koreensis]|uniref:phage distal tail protein n=1 Tax=Priestia koreensis TaxID=284581 RepID=UPI003D028EC2
MRMQEIKCTNKVGESLTISKGSPIFRPIEDIDFTGNKVNNTYASNYKVVGMSHVSSTMQQRDFSLLFYINVNQHDEEWIQERRNEVFRVFNPLLNPIRIEIKTQTQSLSIEANVEITPSIGVKKADANNVWQKALVQFSSGQPYLQESKVQKVEIATWEPLLEFPLNINSNGLEFGKRSQSLIVNVINKGHVPTGMTIQFKALGTVKNPSIFNVNTRESMKLNRTMQAEEIIMINTTQGKKRIESLMNGVPSNIFNTVVFGSKFIQLNTGDNLFRYDADENIENLEVTIYFTPQYLGV